jgi:toxin ParE1/3/4
MKRALQRALAQQDIENAFDYYLSAAGPATAIDFVQEIDACMQRNEHFPESGSSRYADQLDVEGFRFSAVIRFPYLVFYFERPDYLDIVRVLHLHQDIPGILGESVSR